MVLRSVIALPQMPQAGYNKELALGTVDSGRDARILTPPADHLGNGAFFMVWLGTLVAVDLPFVAIQIIGLILCIAFPDIVLWLPRKAGMLD